MSLTPFIHDNDWCPDSSGRDTSAGKYIFMTLCLLFLSIEPCLIDAHAADSTTLRLRHAGRSSGTRHGNEIITILQDSVVFEYGDFSISCSRAKWWRSRGEVRFFNGVAIQRAAQTLSCERLTYLKRTRTVTGYGSVRFADTMERITIRGNRCRYHLPSRIVTLTGSPRFVRIDTAAAESLVISSSTMKYNDSLARVYAEDDLTIEKGKLRAHAGRGEYDTQSGHVALHGMPHVYHEENLLSGDSLDLFFSHDTLEALSVHGRAHGIYYDYTDTSGRRPSGGNTTRDSLVSVTNLWADSIFIRFTDAGRFDTAWLYDNMKSTYDVDRDTSNANTVSGKQMVMLFGEQGNAQRANVVGNARCLYYTRSSQDTITARTTASGDSLSVWFSSGKARRLRLSGDVRGRYIPQ